MKWITAASDPTQTMLHCHRRQQNPTFEKTIVVNRQVINYSLDVFPKFLRACTRFSALRRIVEKMCLDFDAGQA